MLLWSDKKIRVKHGRHCVFSMLKVVRVGK